MPEPIRAGDVVLLLGPEGQRHIVTVAAETRRVPGLGVVKLGDFVGRPWGSPQKLGSATYRALRPLLSDRVSLLERKAQIILPKDASRIVYETGLGAGGRVVEAGVGSGALTLVLAHAVAPDGVVYAYDLRDDHLEQGRRNLERAGLVDRVQFRKGDIAKDVEESDVDAFVLDVPDPGAAVPAAHRALRNGGTLAAYTPIVEQMEAAVRASRAHGFVEVRSLETLERGWVVHERGSRPETNMLAHTGFLTFARRA